MLTYRLRVNTSSNSPNLYYKKCMETSKENLYVDIRFLVFNTFHCKTRVKVQMNIYRKIYGKCQGQ